MLQSDFLIADISWTVNHIFEGKEMRRHKIVVFRENVGNQGCTHSPLSIDLCLVKFHLNRRFFERISPFISARND